MSYVLDRASSEFQRMLRRAGARAPASMFGTRVYYEADQDRMRFVASFAGASDYSWTIGCRQLEHESPGCVRELIADGPGFSRECRSLYSRLYEDHLLELELAPRREAVARLVYEGAQAYAVHVAQRELQMLEHHVRRHHRDRPMFPMRFDADEATVNTLAPSPSDTLTMDDLRRAMQQMREYVDQERFLADFGAFGSARLWTDPKAEAKGIALLKSWLSPEQLASYERQDHFEVTGSDTGKRYRIRYGRQMNIDELGANGERVCGWCFLPEGGLVAGDCMLAQKIALETNETAALKVANRIDSGVDYGRGPAMWSSRPGPSGRASTRSSAR